MGPYPAQDLQPEVSIKRKRGRPRKETSGSSQMGRNQSLETSFQRSGGLSGQFPGPCMAVGKHCLLRMWISIVLSNILTTTFM